MAGTEEAWVGAAAILIALAGRARRAPVVRAERPCPLPELGLLFLADWLSTQSRSAAQLSLRRASRASDARAGVTPAYYPP